jgi:hypothetical protein
MKDRERERERYKDRQRRIIATGVMNDDRKYLPQREICDYPRNDSIAT